MRKSHGFLWLNKKPWETPPTAGKYFGNYVDRSEQTCHHQKNLFFVSRCTIKRPL
ncbi:MAG: hypothetical protein JRC60_07580 [Deltaproteobacteria bacterium]|nr:hypothetical protein [Deltaproteobacteria bacterium]